jgi:hypothetical protein
MTRPEAPDPVVQNLFQLLMTKNLFGCVAGVRHLALECSIVIVGGSAEHLHSSSRAAADQHQSLVFRTAVSQVEHRLSPRKLCA